MIRTRNGLLSLIAWIQLIASLLLAVTIIWGYLTYQSSLGQFFNSIAASIEAVSNVVARTAETVDARKGILNQSAQLIAETRKLINELRVAADNQAKLAPQHAEGLRSMASLTGKLGGLLQRISDGMMFTTPSAIRWDGLKPIVVMSRPLEHQARDAGVVAKDVKGISESMLSIATTIGRDGRNLSESVVATSDQALKVLAEAEKALERINTQDLPKAIEELKTTSKNLNAVHDQVETISNISVAFLVAGLFLSALCFLNSLGSLLITKSRHESQK